jgi:hypothetical protein
VVEHRGDGTVIAKVATFDSIDLTVTIGAWNQLALSKLVGGTVGSVVGTTPNQTISLTHKSTDAAADCAISAQTHSRSADGGQTRLTWPTVSTPKHSQLWVQRSGLRRPGRAHERRRQCRERDGDLHPIREFDDPAHQHIHAVSHDTRTVGVREYPRTA